MAPSDPFRPPFMNDRSLSHQLNAMPKRPISMESVLFDNWNMPNWTQQDGVPPPHRPRRDSHDSYRPRPPHRRRSERCSCCHLPKSPICTLPGERGRTVHRVHTPDDDCCGYFCPDIKMPPSEPVTPKFVRRHSSLWEPKPEEKEEKEEEKTRTQPQTRTTNNTGHMDHDHAAVMEVDEEEEEEDINPPPLGFHKKRAMTIDALTKPPTI